MKIDGNLNIPGTHNTKGTSKSAEGKLNLKEAPSQSKGQQNQGSNTSSPIDSPNYTNPINGDTSGTSTSTPVDSSGLETNPSPDASDGNSNATGNSEDNNGGGSGTGGSEGGNGSGGNGSGGNGSGGSGTIDFDIPILDDISDALDNLGDQVGDLADDLNGGLEDLGDTIGDLGNSLGDLNDTVGGLQDSLGNIPNLINEGFDRLVDEISKLDLGGLEDLKSLIEDLISSQEDQGARPEFNFDLDFEFNFNSSPIEFDIYGSPRPFFSQELFDLQFDQYLLGSLYGTQPLLGTPFNYQAPFYEVPKIGSFSLR